MQAGWRYNIGGGYSVDWVREEVLVDFMVETTALGGLKRHFCLAMIGVILILGN